MTSVLDNMLSLLVIVGGIVLAIFLAGNCDLERERTARYERIAVAVRECTLSCTAGRLPTAEARACYASCASINTRTATVSETRYP